MKHIKIDKTVELPPTRGQAAPASSLAPAGEVFSTPDKNGGEHASLCFIGNATVILEWRGLRIMTDPNFLHAGDHVHLGPGVTSTRLKNPSTDLHDLPRVDLVLLSHYHEYVQFISWGPEQSLNISRDHFDREVEDSLRRDLPIITTPHAYQHLSEAKGDGEAFTAVHPLDPFESLFVDDVANAHGSSIKVTAMPGKHFPPGPGNVFGAMNDALGMVPPTNGWMVELGNVNDGSFNCGYRIYISGDTLMVDELKEIPQRYKDQIIDLLLIHLGMLPLGLSRVHLGLRFHRRHVDSQCERSVVDGDHGRLARPATCAVDKS